MFNSYYLIASGIAGLILGFGVGRYLLKQVYTKIEETSKVKAASILKEAEIKAESLKKEKMLEAKAKAQELKVKQDEEHADRNNKLRAGEERVRQKENTLNQRLESNKREKLEIDQLREKFNSQTEAFTKKQEEIEQIKQTHVQQLEKIAGLSAEDAMQQMMGALQEEAKTRASVYLKDAIEHAKISANREAKRIVMQTIQRTAADHAVENAVSIFNLESDEIKGRIIGREGRNIRALEAATGVDIIVDDTPDAIVISGFDPIRREIARLSLHRLVADGRIHPARIEEVVNQMTKQLDEEIVEVGERTVIDLGIHGLHPELIRLVGKMKYRSSYGQNLLQHSREVADLAAAMASELGLNSKHARRAGLLHDIGKVAEQPEIPHAILGMQLAEKYKEHPDICNAIGAHHDEVEMTALISPIIQACDAISGARPGARREMVDTYIKRLKDLETLALSYPGVTKTFAIQAGRELRVLVESEKVSDTEADQLAFDISNKIQTEMQYPGQIKVTVIREKRSVAYAK